MWTPPIGWLCTITHPVYQGDHLIRIAKRAIAGLAAVGVMTAGAVAATSPATAAERNNNFSIWWGGTSDPSGYLWENYTRSHTDAGNINWTGTACGDCYNVVPAVALKYDSNGHIFVQGGPLDVGTTYRLVSNWGPTKFHVGVRGLQFPDGYVEYGHINAVIYY